MFVCFAPKENPKIAIAVFVQNAGFGATWAGPISRIMVEKYLNDTLMTKSKADLERISNTNLMPAYFKRLQYKEDSTRAFKWFQTTKDSSYIKRFVSTEAKHPIHPSPKGNKPPVKTEEMTAILPDRNLIVKTMNNKNA
jgi:penicillin-binding protein 2